MSSQSNPPDFQKKDLADYGVGRVRDAAFDALRTLWKRRQAEGMLQKDLAEVIGSDPSTVSKWLRGPGNWTLRTIGELTAGLNGELEIRVNALEDPITSPVNYHAYAEYIHDVVRRAQHQPPMVLTLSRGTGVSITLDKLMAPIERDTVKRLVVSSAQHREHVDAN